MKRLGWIAFSSVFVIIGIAVFIFGLKQYSKAKASMDWPQAEGKVISSKVKAHRDSDGTTYGAEINYEYVVDKETITANKVKFGEINTSDSSDASRYVNKYPKGKKVSVYYNTEDVYEAVLEPGVHTSTYFLPGFGLAFALFGGVFVMIGLFSKQFR
ncbi:MAG: DUF3592 domain-containing protein [Lentisphaerales bacterium]|nr:DUF3592 domain-containing protein [Lentisphaerales bacterium]